ncbi:MAG: tRNA lysidine(34) synthetase TilS [bacterium]
MREKFNTNIFTYGLIQKNDSVLVGVSGGADSVCLLYQLLNVQKRVPFTISIVHFNHGLRLHDGKKDAVFVQKLADKNKLRSFIVSIPVRKFARRHKISIEESARNLRYSHLRKLAYKYNYNKIALAHQADDQAETVLFRIIRGTGPHGLAGISFKRRIAETIEIIRPLLNIPKDEIIVYLKKHRISYRIDKTNKKNIYTRNKIRNKLIPYLEKYNPQVKLHLTQLAETMHDENEYWSKKIELLCKKLLKKEAGKFFLDLKGFNKYHIMIQKKVIRSIFQDNCDYTNIISIMRLITSQTGKKKYIPGFGYLEKSYQKLVFHPHKNLSDVNADRFFNVKLPGVTRIIDLKLTIRGRLLTKKPSSLKSSRNQAFFDWEKLGSGRFIIRFRKKGDIFFPYGLNGSKKLKKFLIDQRIPGYKRDQQPLICVEDKIMWVVGIRIDDRWKVTEKTKKILEITLREK